MSCARTTSSNSSCVIKFCRGNRTVSFANRTTGMLDSTQRKTDKVPSASAVPITAASIWITAAIGIVIGMGFYSAAVIGTALALGTLSVFRWVESTMPVVRFAKLTVRFPRQNLMTQDELLEVVRAHDISAYGPSYHLEDDGRVFQYQMSVRTRDAANLHYLAETLCKLEQVQEFTIIPTSD